ncbi:endonuclease III [Methanosarcinales archaeon]|nr:MAG: endonuclease III [Methanosarcinales archaeon]
MIVVTSRRCVSLQADIERIIEGLSEAYRDKKTAVMKVSQVNDPYLVLISCILSLRTKDEVTASASKRLFALARTPGEMVKLEVRDIESAIYPVGFYRRKAKQIKEISRVLLEDYDSQVPDELDELLKFNGVGRKTANIVITVGFGKPGIAVDTHVHRISNRLGLVETKDPDATEFALRAILPEKYWISFNDLLVMHGQTICTPISPKCSICPITAYCKRNGVLRSR